MNYFNYIKLAGFAFKPLKEYVNLKEVGLNKFSMSANQDVNHIESSNSTNINMASIRQTNTQQNSPPNSTTSPNIPLANSSTSINNSTYVNLSHQPPSIEDFPTYDYGFRDPLLPNYAWMSPEQATWKFNLPVIGG